MLKTELSLEKIVKMICGKSACVSMKYFLTALWQLEEFKFKIKNSFTKCINL